MRLSTSMRNACPSDILDKSFNLKHFGKCFVLGANKDGSILVCSDQDQIFSHSEPDVRHYLQEPDHQNELINH